jgi:tetratricopeptide (TPR) repeat protein
MASDPSGGRADEAVAIAMRGVRIVEQSPLPLHHMPAALFADIGHYYSSEATLAAARGDPASAHDLFGKAVAMLERAEAIDREINRKGRERLLRRGLRPGEIHDTGTAGIYRNLGAAYLGLGEPERAIEALSYMVHIQPGSFDALHVLARSQGAAAQLERARGNAKRADDLLESAAVNMIAALLLNSTDAPSWETLAHIYGVLAPAPAAILVSDGRRTLNMNHPAVQRDLRQACAQLVRQLAEGGLTDEAERWRQRLIAEFQMPTALFAPAAGSGSGSR